MHEQSHKTWAGNSFQVGGGKGGGGGEGDEGGEGGEDSAGSAAWSCSFSISDVMLMLSLILGVCDIGSSGAAGAGSGEWGCETSRKWGEQLSMMVQDSGL